jgi:hypothetical protein
MNSAANDTQQVLDLVQRWAAVELAGDVEAYGHLLTADFTGVGPVGFVLTGEQWGERDDELPGTSAPGGIAPTTAERPFERHFSASRFVLYRRHRFCQIAGVADETRTMPLTPLNRLPGAAVPAAAQGERRHG